ncbi:MAG: DUF2291 domain-containing protein [Paracoccus sp. (in: a-proteobacteria)]|jgi:predicted lipoprotein|uniref:DUF2291 family protein n=1 Tax=unclassified Paracoccus (in: a-proteobacteria) TaxID=2688777 RepID=UPI000C40AA57|nr:MULTISPECIES: DUF2291 domain-containing protein [unclassified Paracoccus (in: a-proteobacteria)]MAN57032.1 hypothetical protein [Paracoccus sp. (in: a-proteobacteria)]MBA48725.1 hypothetical protein [Paracoccus sp. (in: a-proteobacteria)]|tara:strand:+ start:95 stop:751 length:657 start_codon:yes stop_codon:yes gene_type:complete
MTHFSSPAPKAPASSRRGLYLGLGVAAALLAGIAFDTTIVTIGSESDVRAQVFSPDDYGQQEFPRIAEFVKGKAVDAATLAPAVLQDKAAAAEQYGTPASTGAIMFTTVTGAVAEGKSGIYTIQAEDVPEEITIRVQTGPAINGTDLRDAPGDITFGQFKNQIEYQNAGAGINRAMKTAVLEPIDTAGLTGRTITVTGAFRLINPKNWLITPVEVSVQ